MVITRAEDKGRDARAGVDEGVGTDDAELERRKTGGTSPKWGGYRQKSSQWGLTACKRRDGASNSIEARSQCSG